MITSGFEGQGEHQCGACFKPFAPSPHLLYRISAKKSFKSYKENGRHDFAIFNHENGLFFWAIIVQENVQIA